MFCGLLDTWRTLFHVSWHLSAYLYMHPDISTQIIPLATFADSCPDTSEYLSGQSVNVKMPMCHPHTHMDVKTPVWEFTGCPDVCGCPYSHAYTLFHVLRLLDTSSDVCIPSKHMSSYPYTHLETWHPDTFPNVHSYQNTCLEMRHSHSLLMRHAKHSLTINQHSRTEPYNQLVKQGICN